MSVEMLIWVVFVGAVVWYFWNKRDGGSGGSSGGAGGSSPDGGNQNLK